MSLSSLLEFAAVTQPPYFSPGDDLELYDEENERWKPLRTTHYSLKTLVKSLHQDSLDPASVRIVEEDARAYLEHLRYTGIDEQLHHDPRMDRSRLVAFADAGYTDVTDLLQSADPIDISRETGIDRTIVTEIATDHVGGFASGNSFGTTGPLADIEPAPRDDFEGWRLWTQTATRIRWVSEGRFQVTVTPTPDGAFAVRCNVPTGDRHAWYRKGWTPAIDTARQETPEAAVGVAHDWLEDHELRFEDDLTTLPGIGPATKDYLALQYEITSMEDLTQFGRDRPTEFDAVFGTFASDLRDSLYKSS